MPKCKNFGVFSNLQVFSLKMSQNKVLTLVKMPNINYLCHNVNICIQCQSHEAISLFCKDSATTHC